MNCSRNVKTKTHNLYKSYKMVLVCVVVVAVSKAIDSGEEYVINHVILTSKPHRLRPSLVNFTSQTCPSKLIHRLDFLSSQYSEFYWSEEENEQVYNIRHFAPFFPYVFTGILADSVGGQRVVLVGLVVSSVVITTQYLVLFRNAYVFISMVAIRRFAEGIMTVAWVSLAVQWARPNTRGTFVGVVVAGSEVGHYLGYLSAKFAKHWRQVCYCSSFLGFVTALWWWAVCGRPGFQHAPSRIIRIPWRTVLTTKHIYILITLAMFEANTRFLMDSFFYHLREVLQYDIAPTKVSNYLLILLFPLTAVTTGLYFGLSSDFVVDRRLGTVETVRKFFLAFTLFFTVLTTLLITQIQCSVTVDLLCCMVGIFMSCLCRANVVAINIDAAPSFACTLFGAATMVGQFVTATSTLLLTKNIPHESKASIYFWNKIFYIMGLYTVLTAMPYLLCVKARPFEQRPRPSGTVTTHLELVTLPEEKSKQNIKDKKI